MTSFQFCSPKWRTAKQTKLSFFYKLIFWLKSFVILLSLGLLSACGSDSENDSIAPVISLNGAESIELGQGRVYHELGATAFDEVDGVIAVILPTNQVATDTLGEYQLTYQATDAAGNIATVVRTVDVVAPRPFITTWKTDAAVGISNSNQVTISTRSGNYSYDYSIDWGDGNIDKNQAGDTTHTYAEIGTYTIKINGDFPNLASYFKDEEKLLSIEQWGDIKWLSMADTLYGAVNVVNNATDTPDLRLVTKFDYMFAEASLFDGDLSRWDVSNVTSFYYMFESSDSFTGDISSWDISSVTDMTGMFHNLTLATAYYDALLIAWSKKTVQSNVDFSAGNSQYSIKAQAARDILVAEHGWNITDAGLAP